MLLRVVAALALLSPTVANAQSPPPSLRVAEESRFLRLTLPGEYMIRGTWESSIPLTAPGNDPSANTLGQNAYALHWLRVSPDLNYDDRLLVRGQIDLLTGVVAGDLARYTSAALRARDSYDG